MIQFVSSLALQSPHENAYLWAAMVTAKDNNLEGRHIKGYKGSGVLWSGTLKMAMKGALGQKKCLAGLPAAPLSERSGDLPSMD